LPQETIPRLENSRRRSGVLTSLPGVMPVNWGPT
jgi:hypothetical protein